MATSEKWKLFVKDGRHNHEICIYYHGHVQTTRLTEEQLKLNEQFRKCHMIPCNILGYFQEKIRILLQGMCHYVVYYNILRLFVYNNLILYDLCCAQTIFYALAKMKKKGMYGRYAAEEVLYAVQAFLETVMRASYLVIFLLRAHYLFK